MSERTVMIEKKKSIILHPDSKTRRILDSYIRDLAEMSTKDKTPVKNRCVYSTKRNAKQVLANGRNIAEIAWIGSRGTRWINSETLMRRVIGEVKKKLEETQDNVQSFSNHIVDYLVITSDMRELKFIWDSLLNPIAVANPDAFPSRCDVMVDEKEVMPGVTLRR